MLVAVMTRLGAIEAGVECGPMRMSNFYDAWKRRSDTDDASGTRSHLTLNFRAPNLTFLNSCITGEIVYDKLICARQLAMGLKSVKNLNWRRKMPIADPILAPHSATPGVAERPISSSLMCYL
jgi:hypothetical protein